MLNILLNYNPDDEDPGFDEDDDLDEESSFDEDHEPDDEEPDDEEPGFDKDHELGDKNNNSSANVVKPNLGSNLSRLLRVGTSGYYCECSGCNCGDYAGQSLSKSVCDNCGHYRENHHLLY